MQGGAKGILNPGPAGLPPPLGMLCLKQRKLVCQLQLNPPLCTLLVVWLLWSGCAGCALLCFCCSGTPGSASRPLDVAGGVARAPILPLVLSCSRPTLWRCLAAVLVVLLVQVIQVRSDLSRPRGVNPCMATASVDALYRTSTVRLRV